MQTVVVNIMLSLPDARLQAAGSGVFWPLRILMGGLFLFSTFALVCAVAFLKRRDWARRAWVALLGLGIAFHVVALVLFFLGVLLHPVGTSDEDVRFAQMLQLMVVPMAVGALGMAILFAWLMKRLLAADVRREFRSSVAA